MNEMHWIDCLLINKNLLYCANCFHDSLIDKSISKVHAIRPNLLKHDILLAYFQFTINGNQKAGYLIISHANHKPLSRYAT